ncbi:cobinamide adenolsyltransferase [Vibrio galatheae]|uniref:Cobinamide adenolsyltransferase n=1 Tax=Vibrio galatheae TaxID=579748 RepID=A0A0F4NJA3_9VIBR|nr:cob(I)alamin adenolsyltransferase/cobinamide ATP-dependent adenolsyltransferase [Vibrio galatheae]KJY82989.1 cobinamide adenolsyltransferase [Vibrio galatheae]
MKIIILHGLYMHGMFLKPLGSSLRSLGYRTKIVSYNSVAIDEQQVFSAIDHALCDSMPNVLVGHSLGGLIIKHYLQSRQPSSDLVSHVVTIGSPIQGASIVTRIQELGMGVILGNSPSFGLAEHDSEWLFPQQLGCIAGTLPLGARSVLMMESEDKSDGTVTVDETKIQGMTDHVEIKTSHTSLIYASAVPRQIDHFVQNNAFDK